MLSPTIVTCTQHQCSIAANLLVQSQASISIALITVIARIYATNALNGNKL